MNEKIVPNKLATIQYVILTGDFSMDYLCSILLFLNVVIANNIFFVIFNVFDNLLLHIFILSELK